MGQRRARIHALVLGLTGMLALSDTALAAPTGDPAARRLKILAAKSEELWRSVRDKDVAAFRRLATDDFVNVDWTGLTSKSELADAIPEYENLTFTLDGFRLARVDPTSAIVLYHVVFHASYHGKQPGPTEFNATDAWTLRNGAWRVVVHTETAVTGTL